MVFGGRTVALEPRAEILKGDIYAVIRLGPRVTGRKFRLDGRLFGQGAKVMPGSKQNLFAHSGHILFDPKDVSLSGGNADTLIVVISVG